MNANPVLLQKKYARIIVLYAKTYGIRPEQAMDLFYRSRLYHEIKEGVSDLHCMSDAYLAEELYLELKEKAGSR